MQITIMTLKPCTDWKNVMCKWPWPGKITFSHQSEETSKLTQRHRHRFVSLVARSWGIFCRGNMCMSTYGLMVRYEVLVIFRPTDYTCQTTHSNHPYIPIPLSSRQGWIHHPYYQDRINYTNQRHNHQITNYRKVIPQNMMLILLVPTTGVNSIYLLQAKTYFHVYIN